MRLEATRTEAFARQSVGASPQSGNSFEGYVDGTLAPASTRGRKRLARIMEAATDLFLRDGYFATSIEAVLEASGGSKATLYSYFSTKEELFRAVVEEAIRTMSPPRLERLGDAKTTLTEYVVNTFETLSAPRHRALLRLTIAERERFPDLARQYYEHGPMHGRRALVELFKELERDRVLRAGTATDVADLFIGSLIHSWLVEALFLGDDRIPSNGEIREKAERIVERFLASASS